MSNPEFFTKCSKCRDPRNRQSPEFFAKCPHCRPFLQRSGRRAAVEQAIGNSKRQGKWPEWDRVGPVDR